MSAFKENLPFVEDEAPEDLQRRNSRSQKELARAKSCPTVNELRPAQLAASQVEGGDPDEALVDKEKIAHAGSVFASNDEKEA